jgi:hypothetical protein
MCDKEIVVCAAIWVQDHKNKPHGPVNIPSGTVFCGLRHCSIIIDIRNKDQYSERNVWHMITKQDIS